MEGVKCWEGVARRHCQGAAIVETVIALPILLAVILGAIQFGLVYEAKATLNHASLQAARAGAVANANPEAIRLGLARGLVLLYSPESSLQGVAATAARINAALLTDARIRILNPTREAFADFGEETSGVREIPNDRLHTRSTTLGAQSGLNIQDANILKVEVTYGYKLKVPLVNWFISRILLSTRRNGGATRAFEQQLLRRTLLPVIATATVRMQSPARLNDLVVSRQELPELARIPSDSPPPKEDGKPHDTAEEGGNEQGGEGGGSNLGDGFLGFGGGSAAGDGAPADGSGGEGGGGSSGNPQMCGDDSGDANAPAVLLPALGVGNPIHVVTGNKYQVETDLESLPGSPAIQFRRHYNSEATGHAGVLGAGWRHSYEASLSVVADGHSIDLWQADGRHLRFDKSIADARYIAQRAGDGELSATATGYRWHWPGGRELLFTAEGRLSAIREGRGSLLLRYNDAQQLIGVIDSQRRKLSFEYFPNGRLAAVRGVARATWRYSYDAVGNLAKSIQPDGSVRRYSYEDDRHPHHLTGIDIGSSRLADYGERAALVHVAIWAYDEKGRAVLSSHPDNAGKIVLRYGLGHTDVTDAFGRLSRYEWNVRDGIAVVSNVRGPGCGRCGQGDVEYRYNESFQLTEVAARYAPVLRYEYDNRRLVAIRRGNDIVARYRYSNDAVEPERIEFPSVRPGGTHFIAFEYTASGQPRRIRESGFAPGPEGKFSAIERAISIDYDAAGRVRSVDGPRADVGDVTEFAYDADGRISVVHSADGSERRVLQYDAAGRPIRVAGPVGTAVGVEYDTAGRITRLTEFRGRSTRRFEYRYDLVGRLIEAVNPNGRERHVGYDAAGRPARVSMRGSDTVEGRTYAPDGQLTAAAVFTRSGELLRALHYSYDAQRRLSEVRDGDGPPLRRYTYRDDDAEPSGIVDPLGFVTSLSYDGFGSLTAILAPDSGITRFARDATGRLASVTAPNDAQTKYAYDDFGRRVREDSPDRGQTQYRYDAAGNPIERIDARGETIRRAYDATNRLVEVTDRQGTTRLEYNKGLLAAVNAPNWRERFSYDDAGRPVSHSRSIANVTLRTSYGYDRDGHLKASTLPSGVRLRYRYTREGVLQAVLQEGWLSNRLLLGDFDRRVGIDPVGRLAFGNRLTGITDYDTQTGRIARRTTSSVSVQKYEYDEAGRVVGASDNKLAGSYGYDSVGRLIAATNSLDTFS
ncbi:MAG TPA: DUF6531 domain-containing protein [Steroidobacteraceae bacterium]|jgi:YD repeat-containing protein